MYRGEKRDPVIMILLSVITCGICFIIWSFKVCNEINSFYGEKKIDPTIFFLLGILCFPLVYVGLYKLDELLYDMNTRMGLPANKNFILWLLLSFVGIGGIFAIYQIQEQLNKIWDRSSAPA